MQFPGRIDGKCTLDQGSLWGPGADHQLQEVIAGSPTGDSVLGVPHINSVHEDCPANGKDEKNSAGGNTFVERDNSVNSADCCLYWDH